jgi:hypothetical protein
MARKIGTTGKFSWQKLASSGDTPSETRDSMAGEVWVDSGKLLSSYNAFGAGQCKKKR